MKPLLSILIPTVIGREEQLNPLMDKLFYLITNDKLFKREYKYLDESLLICRIWFNGFQVEIVTYKDDKSMTIGEKREELYKLANGLYSFMLDDDDDISDNAIELILDAIKSNPEIPCITFKEKCLINGVYKSSNHSIKYPQWMDNSDGYDYVRCPFYKDVIRTDIAKSVPFEKIRYNEDERWSMAIKPLLIDEIHIGEEIYHYIYNETNHEERYGIV